MPDFNGFTNPKVWIAGATIAIVASIETCFVLKLPTDWMYREELPIPIWN
jgi:hypothetical protein